MTKKKEKQPTIKKGSGSFCIPNAAIDALIAAKADAYVIGAYLTLAAHTDPTGVYSTASQSAVRRRLSANRDKVTKVFEALAAIKVRPKKGKHIPLIYTADAWMKETGEVFAEPATERAKINHVLPDMGEELYDRVWIGKGLVLGYGQFTHPLKQLKQAGDVAARLLLKLYQVHDLEGWGGVPPYGNVYQGYARSVMDEGVIALGGGGTLLRAKRRNKISSHSIIDAALDESRGESDIETFWDALEALETVGLIYESVMVLDRNAELHDTRNKDCEEKMAITKDAAPLYELDNRSHHGYKPKGEMGLAGITANTAGAIDYPVTGTGGNFNGTYAAIVPRGYGVSVCGVYRLRFRVANAKNHTVKDAWVRISEGNREALTWINSVRKAHGLEPITDAEKAPNKTK